MTHSLTADERSATLPTGTRGLNVLRRLLFAPRLKPAFGKMEAVVLGLYALVLAITIPFHEQWADEAQAWLIARDSSLWDIFYRRLHYEGTPGLWHLILWVAARLHLPYASINWIGALFATAGVYLWLRYSPFPVVLRVLFPFTFWMQYQYAAIARAYALMPLLAFALCALFRTKPRPVLFALLAGLLANLSLYGFLWAGSLAIVYYARLWRKTRTETRSSTWICSASLLCALFLFAFYTALPAPDLIGRQDGATLFEHRAKFQDKLVPPTPIPAGWSSAPKPPVHADSPFPPDSTKYTRGNSLQRAIIRTLYPQQQNYRVQTLGHRLSRVIMPVNALLFSVSAFNVLAVAVWGIALVWLAARHGLLYLLALVPMAILAAMTKINDHHAGLFFLVLICAVWIALLSPRGTHRTDTRLLPLLMLALLATFLEQTAWSVHAVVGDIRHPYDPGLATAKFLRSAGAGKRIIAYPYETVSMAPFLPPHPFIDQPTSYWMWSSSFPYDRIIPVEIKSHPDFVVVGMSTVEDQQIANQIVPDYPLHGLWMALDPRDLAAAGYHEVARFCGTPFMRSSSGITYCFAVYAPERAPGAR